MICPNCNEKIDLTLKRYFKSLFGKHDCPSCYSSFKLKRTKIYFLWIFLSIIIASGGSFLILTFVTDKNFLELYYTIWLWFIFFICCYIDRKIENNLPTVEIK